MLYNEIQFRGNYVLTERSRVEKENLVSASFSAYQLLSAKHKLPTWSKYIKQLGLSSEPVLTKEDLKREADQAMENVRRIIEKARGKSGRG